MKVLMLDAPQAMLDERRRLGLDGRDEMWDGVLHLVPPAGGPHQRMSADFLIVVGPIARNRGLRPHVEAGLFLTSDDYRVPDQMYCRPQHLSARGAEGAELVVEFRSLSDETYRKIEFYTAVGVREMLVVHPDSGGVELFKAVSGELRPLSLDAEGALVSEVLGVRFRTVDGRLHLTWNGGSAEI